MRTFLAVFPPPLVQAAIADRIERARVPGDGISWVKRDNLHYTMRFLGELSPARVERASRAAAAAVVGASAFDARLGPAGAFPDFRRPRVLFFGLEEGAAALEILARSLDEALRREGFGPPDKPFRAHLTIGRVREPAGRSLEGTLGPLREEWGELRFAVQSLTLVESRLDPRGSIYRPIGEYPLQAP